MSILTVVTIDVKEGYRIDVHKLRKVKRPRFGMYGLGERNRYNMESINLLTIMRNSTDAGRLVIDTIGLLIDFHNSDGVVKVPMSDFSNYDKLKWAKGYKELSNLGFVLRTKRSHYLLNPCMLIPVDYEASVIIWNEHTVEKFRIAEPTL